MIKKLLKTFRGIYAIVLAWIKALHVSPITRAICNKILLDAVYKTALYPLANKARQIPRLPICPVSPLDDPIERAFTSGYEGIPKTTTIGTFMSLPPRFGRLMPWPDGFVRYQTETHAESIREGLDGTIIDQIISHTAAADRLVFKKCLTAKQINEAVEVYDKLTGVYFGDSDGKHLICVTSRGRIETDKDELTREGSGWEDVEFYGDYIDRELYPNEYGRLKIADRLYVVFLTTLDDRMFYSAVFGPDAFTITPLEGNLKATFQRTAAGEAGRQPRGIDVGFEMQLGAVADLTRCVILEATKAVGK